MYLERNVSGLVNTLEDNGIVIPAHSPEKDREAAPGMPGPGKQNGISNGVKYRNGNGRASDGEDVEAVSASS